MYNNFYKFVAFASLAIFVNTSSFALELPISTQLGLMGSLGVKLNHPQSEPFGKGLPLGPSSARFFNGNLWVSDTLNHRLMQFKADGSYVGAVTLHSAPEASPSDFCLVKGKDGKTKYWVCDEDNSSVSLFDDSGNLLASLGSLEKDDFICPCQIEQLPNGNMVVLDRDKHEIIELDWALKVVGSAKTDSRTMLIANGKLLYVSISENGVVLNERDLKTGSLKSRLLSIQADPEPDILACDGKGGIVFGLRQSFGEGALQYRLMKLPVTEPNMPSIAIAYPPSFVVRPLVADNQGRYYSYYLDTLGEQPALKLQPINLNFSLKGSKG